MIVFSIPGEPYGKARQRSTIIKPKFGEAFISNYTPKETVQYENLVKTSFRLVHCGNPEEGPVSVEIIAFFPIPKSTTKKKQSEMINEAYPVTKKPDCDNIIKVILDGLNQIAWRDDSQVYNVKCTKLYSLNPRTIVKLLFEEPAELPF